jgi:hypothetical protein
MEATTQADFCVSFDGSIGLLAAQTPAGKTWASEHLPADAPTLGKNVAIEARYLGAVLQGIVASGLTFRLAN